MKTTKPAITRFESNLTWWVLACIVIGIALGKIIPNLFQAIGNMQIEQVNLPVAILIWLMIIPMLLKIDLSKMANVFQHRKGIAITLTINWLIKPFSMALLAWVFIRHFFAFYLPAE